MTNNFLAFGITAGLGAMVLLVALLKRTFSDLGKTLAVLRSNSEPAIDIEFLYWGLAVMLVVHTANWFGITYFAQTYVLWFMQLSVISTLTQIVIQAEPKKLRWQAIEPPSMHPFSPSP